MDERTEIHNPTNVQSTTLLFDADFLVHRACLVHQRTFDFGDVVSIEVDRVAALRMVQSQIEAFARDFSTKRVWLAFSDPKRNWRKSVLATYKANRTAEKPAAFEWVRAKLKGIYPCFEWEGLEADDVLGILATGPTQEGDRRVIVSVDKDFYSVPGWFCRIKIGDATTPEAIYSDPDRADKWHMAQALMGDTTDGYSGCPGIGPSKALQALGDGYKMVRTEKLSWVGKGRFGEPTKTVKWTKEPCKNLWEIVVSFYHSKGLTEEDALRQARVARILRHGEYDNETGKVKLWTPSV